MIGTRHEEYSFLANDLSLVFNADLIRTPISNSTEKNWHEDIEFQLCVEGKGWVLLDGKKLEFNTGDVIAVNSNVIHYTGTDNRLVYSCIIIKSEFCKQINIDCERFDFSERISGNRVLELFRQIRDTYLDESAPFRTAKLYKLATEMLIQTAEQTIPAKRYNTKTSEHQAVKQAIRYIRENYAQKIYIEQISKAVAMNKFALCRVFKKLTGQTIVENINRYRVLKAVEYLKEDYSVGQTAFLCGFENLSFFTTIFKRYTSKLPSQVKKNAR